MAFWSIIVFVSWYHPDDVFSCTITSVWKVACTSLSDRKTSSSRREMRSESRRSSSWVCPHPGIEKNPFGCAVLTLRTKFRTRTSCGHVRGNACTPSEDKPSGASNVTNNNCIIPTSEWTSRKAAVGKKEVDGKQYHMEGLKGRPECYWKETVYPGCSRNERNKRKRTERQLGDHRCKKNPKRKSYH